MYLFQELPYSQNTFIVLLLVVLAGCLYSPEAITILTPPEGFDESQYFDLEHATESQIKSFVPPGFLDTPKIRITEQALAHKAKGQVILRLYINKRGDIDFAEFHEKMGFRMDQEIVRAMQDVTFRPAILKGRPVNSVIHLPVLVNASGDRTIIRRAPGPYHY